jgi:hypothetical protein
MKPTFFHVGATRKKMSVHSNFRGVPMFGFWNLEGHHLGIQKKTNNNNNNAKLKKLNVASQRLDIDNGHHRQFWHIREPKQHVWSGSRK